MKSGRSPSGMSVRSRLKCQAGLIVYLEIAMAYVSGLTVLDMSYRYGICSCVHSISIAYDHVNAVYHRVFCAD